MSERSTEDKLVQSNLDVGQSSYSITLDDVIEYSILRSLLNDESDDEGNAIEGGETLSEPSRTQGESGSSPIVEASQLQVLERSNVGRWSSGRPRVMSSANSYPYGSTMYDSIKNRRVAGKHLKRRKYVRRVESDSSESVPQANNNRRIRGSHAQPLADPDEVVNRNGDDAMSSSLEYADDLHDAEQNEEIPSHNGSRRSRRTNRKRCRAFSLSESEQESKADSTQQADSTDKIERVHQHRSKPLYNPTYADIIHAEDRGNWKCIDCDSAVESYTTRGNRRWRCSNLKCSTRVMRSNIDHTDGDDESERDKNQSSDPVSANELSCQSCGTVPPYLALKWNNRRDQYSWKCCNPNCKVKNQNGKSAGGSSAVHNLRDVSPGSVIVISSSDEYDDVSPRGRPRRHSSSSNHQIIKDVSDPQQGYDHDDISAETPPPASAGSSTVEHEKSTNRRGAISYELRSRSRVRQSDKKSTANRNSALSYELRSRSRVRKSYKEIDNISSDEEVVVLSDSSAMPHTLWGTVLPSMGHSTTHSRDKSMISDDQQIGSELCRESFSPIPPIDNDEIEELSDEPSTKPAAFPSAKDPTFNNEAPITRSRYRTVLDNILPPTSASDAPVSCVKNNSYMTRSRNRDVLATFIPSVPALDKVVPSVNISPRVTRSRARMSVNKSKSSRAGLNRYRCSVARSRAAPSRLSPSPVAQRTSLRLNKVKVKVLSTPVPSISVNRSSYLLRSLPSRSARSTRPLSIAPASKKIRKFARIGQTNQIVHNHISVKKEVEVITIDDHAQHYEQTSRWWAIRQPARYYLQRMAITTVVDRLCFTKSLIDDIRHFNFVNSLDHVHASPRHAPNDASSILHNEAFDETWNVPFVPSVKQEPLSAYDQCPLVQIVDGNEDFPSSYSDVHDSIQDMTATTGSETEHWKRQLEMTEVMSVDVKPCPPTNNSLTLSFSSPSTFNYGGKPAPANDDEKFIITRDTSNWSRSPSVRPLLDHGDISDGSVIRFRRAHISCRSEAVSDEDRKPCFRHPGVKPRPARDDEPLTLHPLGTKKPKVESTLDMFTRQRNENKSKFSCWRKRRKVGPTHAMITRTITRQCNSKDLHALEREARASARMKTPKVESTHGIFTRHSNSEDLDSLEDEANVSGSPERTAAEKERKKVHSIVKDTFFNIVQPHYNDVVRPLALAQFKQVQQAGELLVRPVSIQAVGMLVPGRNGDSILNGSSDVNHPQEYRHSGAMFPVNPSTTGWRKYKLFNDARPRPMVIDCIPTDKHDETASISICNREGGLTTGVCTVIHMDELLNDHTNTNFVRSVLNIRTEDNLQMTHVPFMDFEDTPIPYQNPKPQVTEFVRKLNDKYEQGIHGQRKGCGRAINHYQLWNLLNLVIPNSANRSAESLNYVFMSLSKLFPNECSFQQVAAYNTVLEKLNRRFSGTVSTRNIGIGINFRPDFFCTKSDPKCFESGCLRPRMPSGINYDSAKSGMLNTLVNHYFENGSNVVEICKQDVDNIIHSQRQRELDDMIPHKIRISRFLDVRKTQCFNESIPTHCDHDGKCTKANGCKCLESRNGVCSTRCRCSVNCRIRFPGCTCSAGKCRGVLCPCWRAGWECDPKSCTGCNCDLDHPRMIDGVPMERCGNIRILVGSAVKLQTRKSIIDTAGSGCFVLQDVEKNALVAEYMGEIISHEETERRGVTYTQLRRSYTFKLNKYFDIDAIRYGNDIRYANHSVNASNIIPKVMNVRGEQRIGMFAARPLLAGEELFFDYNYNQHVGMESIDQEVDPKHVQSVLQRLKHAKLSKAEEAKEQKPSV